MSRKLYISTLEKLEPSEMNFFIDFTALYWNKEDQEAQNLVSRLNELSEKKVGKQLRTLMADVNYYDLEVYSFLFESLEFDDWDSLNVHSVLEHFIYQFPNLFDQNSEEGTNRIILFLKMFFTNSHIYPHAKIEELIQHYEELSRKSISYIFPKAIKTALIEIGSYMLTSAHIYFKLMTHDEKRQIKEMKDLLQTAI